MDTDKQLHGDTRFSLLFHMVLNSGCLNFSCEPLGCITAKFTARRGHREITMGAVPRQDAHQSSRTGLSSETRYLKGFFHLLFTGCFSWLPLV